MFATTIYGIFVALAKSRCSTMPMNEFIVCYTKRAEARCGGHSQCALTAVELGHQLGATVIATASNDQKLTLAQKYGADHLINYREESFCSRVKEITDGKGANVIFDPVAGNQACAQSVDGMIINAPATLVPQ